jgi:hypothetical protein
VKRLLHAVCSTGIWAPALVLVLHEFLSVPGWRTQVDWFNHFAGGLSFTFFAWKSLPLLFPWTGPLTPAGRLAAAFLSGCTAALLWDIGEFTSDMILHTTIQKSLEETMMDLLNGFLGTTLCTLVITFSQRKHLAPHR